MFRTIRAKYSGSVCRRCGSSIQLGEQFRYGGPSRCYHLARVCPKGTGYTDDPPYAHLGNYNDPELVEPASLYRADYVSNIAVFSSGAETYTNKRGRCEDAPCCGCCS